VLAVLMRPRMRRFVLTCHIACSVGWLGAVATSFALALAALIDSHEMVARAAVTAMDLVARWVLVPLSVASLLTGLIQSLGSQWGLARHYWILVKLVMNVVATAVLMLYLQTLGSLTRIAETPSSTLADLSNPSPVAHSSAAILVLAVATALSVYKPRGLTPRGRRLARRTTTPHEVHRA
jgi:hypothetical protein